jgi:hypothetical protein
VDAWRVLASLDGSVQGGNERRAVGQEAGQLTRAIPRRLRIGPSGVDGQVPHPDPALADGALSPKGHGGRIPGTGQEGSGQALRQGLAGATDHSPSDHGFSVCSSGARPVL